MSAEPLDENDLRLILYLHNQSVTSSFYVEDDYIFRKKTSAGIAIFYILRAAPAGLINFMIPSIELAFGVTEFKAILDESFSLDDIHREGLSVNISITTIFPKRELYIWLHKKCSHKREQLANYGGLHDVV
jgi:hypothetical protein